MSYNTFNKKLATSTILTGIRHANKNKYKKSKKAFITGFYKVNGVQTGFIYKGSVLDSDYGMFYPLKFPNSYLTSPYGPDRITDDKVNIVGNYNLTTSSPAIGFLYTGPYQDSKLGNWVSIIPPFENASNCIMHSVMNGIVVGNYGDNPMALANSLEINKSKIYAVLFNSRTNQYFKITIPNVDSISAYGIWHNGDSNYTIAGGYSKNKKNRGYIVDWNEETGKFTNLSSYKYNNDNSSIITHFDGITRLENGKYNLTGDYVNENGPGAFFCSVNRSNNSAIWTNLSYPQSSITSGNTVIDNKAYGIYIL
jgi:hypothetical protein